MAKKIEIISVEPKRGYWEEFSVMTSAGPVEVAFTDSGHAHISVDAHINDDNPTVVWRGRDLIGSTHVYRELGWNPKDDSSYDPHVTYRDNWSDACQTARNFFVSVASAAAAHIADNNPRVGLASELRTAENEYAKIEKEIADTHKQLNILRKNLSDATLRLSDARENLQ